MRHMRLERSDPMYQIMLVEDEILVRESMVQNTNWRALGFDTPIACSDGREAMQVLETVLRQHGNVSPEDFTKAH